MQSHQHLGRPCLGKPPLSNVCLVTYTRLATAISSLCVQRRMGTPLVLCLFWEVCAFLIGPSQGPAHVLSLPTSNNHPSVQDMDAFLPPSKIHCQTSTTPHPSMMLPSLPPSKSCQSTGIKELGAAQPTTIASSVASRPQIAYFRQPAFPRACFGRSHEAPLPWPRYLHITR